MAPINTFFLSKSCQIIPTKSRLMSLPIGSTFHMNTFGCACCGEEPATGDLSPKELINNATQVGNVYITAAGAAHRAANSAG